MEFVRIWVRVIFIRTVAWTTMLEQLYPVRLCSKLIYYRVCDSRYLVAVWYQALQMLLLHSSPYTIEAFKWNSLFPNNALLLWVTQLWLGNYTRHADQQQHIHSLVWIPWWLLCLEPGNDVSDGAETSNKNNISTMWRQPIDCDAA